MSEEDVFANHNFIANGDFAEGLDDWIINDESKVTRQEGLWQGKAVGYMNAVNMGEGEQTIMLATLPRPTPGRADYKLMFHYEAVSGAVGTLRINPGLGGEVNLTLVPSRESEPEPEPDEADMLLDLNLVEYPYLMQLGGEERTVKFTVISPDNGGPGRPGAVRVTFVRVELLLEPLRLDGVTIDGESQPLGEPLHLCFGASHRLALQPAADSIWTGTEAGLLVNDGLVDPERMLSAGPDWGREHPISDPWTITCARETQDHEYRHVLAVRSQYTADTYPLRTVTGHFQLDVIALQEAAWYPVVDLNQSVELRVQVLSHYVQVPLEGREVTWTLKGPDGSDDIVLCRQPTDENGEAGFTWTPQIAGDWQVEASVDSFYKKENARHAFAVRALQHDPWLSARFALDGLPREWVWGTAIAYPCRGATHELALAFAQGHALAEADLSLNWQGEDTPEGLGMTFTPALDTAHPVVGNGQKWQMGCGNFRNSRFGFNVRCSKLLEPSPLQTLEMAHNWLEIGEIKQPTRFPSVGGPDLRLEVQIRSRAPSLEGVSGIEVQWSVDGGTVTPVQTGDEGWSVYGFMLEREGSFRVTASVDSPYDGAQPSHEFTVNVMAEDPWSQLVTVTLDGRPQERVGLLCVGKNEPVDLLIKPRDAFVGEEIYLDLVNEPGQDLGFHVEPALETRRTLTAEGLVWKVRSDSATGAPFELHVLHDELPPYSLQGRLLPNTLEGEGTFRFDGRELPLASTAYPCLGGRHTVGFTPAHGSQLTGLEMAAGWDEKSAPAPHARLVPDFPRELSSGGLEWEIDASDSLESAVAGLALNLPQARYAYPPVQMSLGHNRIEITDVRGPTFDVFVGETAQLQIRSRSYYTERAVPGVEVSFSHEGHSTPVPTQDDGWARFPFTATRPGSVQVIATVPSPYDDSPPSFAFEFEVLAEAEAESASYDVPSNEVMPMSEEQRSETAAVEISEVREPAFDPAVGESVWMGLKIHDSGTRRAASGVEVTFVTEQQRVTVATDGNGWASFAYSAQRAGDVSVVATLNGSQTAHTFNFKALAADVWKDALIQLNTDVPKTAWGAETRFPRTGSSHTIKLSVDNAGSHLVGREICLGLKGFSSARDLGLTSIQPALGVYRPLTAAGLSWTFSGGAGGAYALQLEAPSLLKPSPVNAMSLGPVPPEALAED